VSKVYEVVVVTTVETNNPDEAVAFVRGELLSKLGTGEPVWQTERPDVLPRWEVRSVRSMTRRDETGAEAQGG
jgi:hypothetical protein